ncbi:MAG: phosphatidate cytidylyltransferase, partial [Rhodoferax sp.]
MYHTLKNLSPAQQVGAMFVLVFGLLVLASVSLFLLSMREHEDAQAQQNHRDRIGKLSKLLRTSWALIFV